MNQEPPQPRRRRFCLFLFGILVLLVVLGVSWWWMRQKSVGVTRVQVSSEAERVEEIVKEAHYQGQYFTLAYPGDYELRTEGEGPAYPVLERLLLFRSNVEGRKIVGLVQEVGPGLLEEYPHFQVRSMDGETYTRENVKVNGKSYIFFSKQNAVYEVGAFWQVATRAYSLVVSSPLRSEGLREELVKILESLTHVEPAY